MALRPITRPASPAVLGTGSVARRKRRTFGETVFRVMLYTVLITVGVVLLLPFYWMVTASLKSQGEIFLFPPHWLPRPPQWNNYTEALVRLNFPLHLRNTSIITAAQIVGSLLSCSMAAYAFARVRFPGRDIFFVVCLTALMLPFHITLIPTYILYKELGWLRTFLPLVVPPFLGLAPVYIFLLRQFFMTIPSELCDAAAIDGCGILGTFWRLVLPMSKPALATVAIFAFMEGWNDFLRPLIYLSNRDTFPLSVAIQFFQEERGVFWQYIMAIAFLMMLPCLLLFFLAQKTFIQGVVITGVKG